MYKKNIARKRKIGDFVSFCILEFLAGSLVDERVVEVEMPASFVYYERRPCTSSANGTLIAFNPSLYYRLNGLFITEPKPSS